MTDSMRHVSPETIRQHVPATTERLESGACQSF